MNAFPVCTLSVMLVTLLMHTPPLFSSLIEAVASPHAIGTLSTRSKRCSDQSYTFTSLPKGLIGKETIAFKRGSDKAAFAVSMITLTEESAVYLFVHKRGNAGIPSPWKKITMTAQWSVGAYSMTDEVFKQICPAGDVVIPGHIGKEGGKYAVPHFIVVVRASDDTEQSIVPTGIKSRWPKTPAPVSVSKVWEEFRNAPKKDNSLTLPDFSYAGYRQGKASMQARGKIFPVTQYGAIPDDMVDDGAAMQRAINACAEQGGGIVYLPRGRYLVNTDMASRRPIEITNSGIVLKGEGPTNGGTIIHQIHPFETGVPPSDPRHYHLGQSVIYLRSRAEETPLNERPDIAQLIGYSSNDIFSISVDTSAKLAVGQHILLYASSKAMLTNMLAPRLAKEEWNSLTKLPRAAELHTIAGIDGSRIVFEEPIRYPIDPADGWTLKPCTPIHESGIEDICFMGNAYAKYVHHRNDIEDSGWASIRVKGVADGWIQRCSFINVSQTINVALSSSVSLINIFVLGNQGHHIPRIGYFTYGVLGGLIEDRANFTHGPSVSQMALGTVYWRCSMSPSQPIDSHAGRPFVTLFDRIDGGSLFGSTGGLRDFPQHMRKLVIWNFKHGVTTENDTPFLYDFWHNNNTAIFLDPIIVGLHGRPAEFNEDTLEYLESLGTPVKPESLYEAQLALRLGTVPAWIDDSRREYNSLRTSPFPVCYDRTNPASSPFPYKETFRIDDALRFVTYRALRVFGKEFFTYTIDDASTAVFADAVLVRNALYTGMAFIYSFSKDGNTITVTKQRVAGREHIRFLIASGGNDIHVEEDVTAHADYRDVCSYMRILGGSARYIHTDGGMQLVLVMPMQ